MLCNLNYTETSQASDKNFFFLNGLNYNLGVTAMNWTKGHGNLSKNITVQRESFSRRKCGTVHLKNMGITNCPQSG